MIGDWLEMVGPALDHVAGERFASWNPDRLERQSRIVILTIAEFSSAAIANRIAQSAIANHQ